MDIDRRLHEAGHQWRQSQGPALPTPKLDTPLQKTPPRRWMTGLIPLAASAAVAATVIGVVVLHDAPASHQVPGGSTSTSSPTSSPTPAPTASTPAQASSTVTAPATATATATASAEGALVKFIDAAREVDSRLRYAAGLINGAVRSDTIVVDARTVAAVKATDPSAVAAAIPAGMPPKLMLPVLTVYSDLVSRSASMRHFGHAETYPRLPSADQGPSQYESLLGDLANGSPATHRFAADLSAVMKSARSTPPLMAVGPTSLASAELAVRREYIRKSNTGCDEAGGHVATTLASIIWDDTARTATTRTGSIADQFAPAGEGVKFTATSAGGDIWTAVIWAC